MVVVVVVVVVVSMLLVIVMQDRNLAGCQVFGMLLLPLPLLSQLLAPPVPLLLLLAIWPLAAHNTLPTHGQPVRALSAFYTQHLSSCADNRSSNAICATQNMHVRSRLCTGDEQRRSY
jgi:hypothetical protein